jgi:hypothetical protein
MSLQALIKCSVIPLGPMKYHSLKDFQWEFFHYSAEKSENEARLHLVLQV